VKQYVGPGNVYYLQRKNKSSICRLFLPNHCRESCQPSSGANCFQRVRLDGFFTIHVHVAMCTFSNLSACVYSLWSSYMWCYFTYMHHIPPHK